MSTHDTSDEQPRKKPRLTGPGDTPSSASLLVDSIASVASNGQPNPKSDAVPTVDAEVVSQSEQEQRAGITAYVANTSGFTGIVKKRYTDFLVNEILPSGQVVHLEEDALKEEKPKTEAAPAGTVEQASDAKAPTQPNANGAAQSDGSNGQGQAGQTAQTIEQRKEEAMATIPEADTVTLEAIFGTETTKSMVSLYGRILARPDRKTRDYGSVSSPVISDKQARTNAHIAVRRIFNGRIETQTADDETITIKAAPSTAKPRQGRPQGHAPMPKGKVGWDELGGQHLHFTLYKENKDTMEVLYFLASQLKLAVKNFQFAGTKDRRGVTVQRVSAYRVPADRLKHMNGRLRGAVLGGFKYEQNGLELGELYGNEFVITLRDCQFPGDESRSAPERLESAKSVVAEAIRNFQARGFINYYGLQRFGSFSVSTDDVGKKMLKGDLEGAVKDILTYSPVALAEVQNPDPSGNTKISADDKARAEALHAWQQSGKMSAAVDKLPRKFQAENAIIRHLGWTDRKSGVQRQKNDWQGALMGIARNLRLMYVHAYQSLVWNVVAGKRLELYGDKVVEGDLVIVSEHEDKDASNGEEEIDDEGEVIVRPAKEDAATAVEDKFERARPLSKAEAESGRYSIFDIVLPLPGFDVLYPANAVGAFYKEFMASERGGGLDPYQMRRSWKDISLSGSYRKMMARPANVAYEVHSYVKDDEQMVETDLEKLQKQQKGEQAGSKEADADAGAEGVQEEKVAVVIKMQLGSSQYATMALRELTKGGAVTYKPDFQGGR